MTKIELFKMQLDALFSCNNERKENQYTSDDAITELAEILATQDDAITELAQLVSEGGCN